MNNVFYDKIYNAYSTNRKCFMSFSCMSSVCGNWGKLNFKFYFICI